MTLFLFKNIYFDKLGQIKQEIQVVDPTCQNSWSALQLENKNKDDLYENVLCK